MVTIVPSRFAGLRIEDDDDDCAKPSQKQKTTPNQKNTQSTSAGKQNQAGNQQSRKTSKPKKPRKSVNEEAQNKQWSQWQEKDNEIVDNHYEKDLEQAVMLSKLDFEENKLKYRKAEQEVKLSTKSKKSRPLSLQQFQTKVDKNISEKEIQKQREAEEAEYNKRYTFFEQINLDTKQIIQKEQVKSLVANRKYRPESSTPAENGNNENASPEATELDQLRAENATLRAELAGLRVMHKKICTVLKTGQMKDKTELLLEIEKLKKVQEDMAAEMTALYEQLEQEKSKIGGSGHEKGKEKPGGKKSVRFNAASEIHNGKTE